MSQEPSTPDAGTPDVVAPDEVVLQPLREQLEQLGEVDLEQRPALLERANAALVDALSDLEEV